MRRQEYRKWLEEQKYSPGTVSTQMSDVGRVEDAYGDLDEQFKDDRFESILAELKYSAEDQRSRRPNPSKLNIQGDLRNGLASYLSAVRRYAAFLGGADTVAGNGGDASAKDIGPTADPADARIQRISLERDMQVALRISIQDLEAGLQITDDGAERSVESGFIDITARDPAGANVVIELKAGQASQRAVAQILSYMGDIASEEPETSVRGILVASSFDRKSIAAARMVPSLTLRAYSVRFQFMQIE